jgi:Na+/H+-translocating membrane pyrophosphatase
MAQGVTDVTPRSCAIAILLGLWSGLVIGFLTEYFTSSTYVPVREFAETQKQSASTGIIYGLARGYLSCVLPVCCLAVSVLVAPSSAACSVWPSAPSACLGP